MSCSVLMWHISFLGAIKFKNVENQAGIFAFELWESTRGILTIDIKMFSLSEDHRVLAGP